MTFIRKFLTLVVVGLAMFATGTASAQNSKEPSGKVSISETQFGFIVGGSVGGGDLEFKGKKYPFKIGGLSVGANFGISKLSAAGEVYDLQDVSKFPGTYVKFDGNITLGGGVGGMVLKNENGVIMRLTTTQQGIQLNLSANGVSVKFD